MRDGAAFDGANPRGVQLAQALANTQRLIEAPRPRRRIRWPWQRETWKTAQDNGALFVADGGSPTSTLSGERLVGLAERYCCGLVHHLLALRGA